MYSSDAVLLAAAGREEGRSLPWSDELALTPAAWRVTPPAVGVFLLLQDLPYPRYNGVRAGLYIGAAPKGLRAEIGVLFNQHTIAIHLQRAYKQTGMRLTCRYATIETASVESVEDQLFQDFEDAYWEPPVRNSQRGYKRGADRWHRH